ncbi:hypothetical protein OC25_03665 [Pedobacter kyungheensis]|uniref:Peptidase C14 caspase domain-containing protein n=1 Tax=Pedobacter kyungheensis TaxID=1069985 RepID=A0A0C1DEX7_9SPHI|nr:caspase family protein [Pedobacter kyungheensis]KIA96191.1 hypothetical protein OC25_03665 [Pedobacter kyungheensis]
MKKCAILIGINEIQKLPTLSASRDNATKMNEWALGQGFETSLFIDDTGPVSFKEIQNAVDEYVKDFSYEQMLIYFSGHGYLAGPGQEVWMLSDAMSDQSQSIGLQSSIMFARFTKLKNLIIISDACRTPSRDIAAIGNPGLPIFKFNDNPASLKKVDIFYASLPGNPAHEVLISPDHYKSVYTECLLEGLNGEVPEIITTLAEGTTTTHVVHSYELNEYLQLAIPTRLIELEAPINQQPSGEITSRTPIFISEISGYSPDRASTTIRPAEPDEDYPGIGLPKAFEESPKIKKEIEQNIEDILSSGSESDITTEMDVNTGLKITGEIPKKVWENGHIRQMPKDTSGSNLFFGSTTDSSSVILIQLENGTGIPFTLLKGYHANAVIRNGQLININYVPSPLSYKRFQYVELEQKIKEQKAEIITAAQFGIFSPSRETHSIFANYIRTYKALDPTLGLFAAYAYALSGNFKQIRSVYRHMAREEEPVLRDVAILNGFAQNQDFSGHELSTIKKNTFMPLLTQGWSYMELYPKNNLFELSKTLIPGLWTSFTKDGIEILNTLLQNRR